jgi:hypothetical protein
LNKYCRYYIGLVIAISTSSSTQAIEIADGQTSAMGATNCNFTKPIPLKTTRRYGLLGDDEFDTLVCGHIVTKQEKNFGQTITVAYLRIIKADDRRFLLAIQREISKGNGVNFVRGNYYFFNLGCLEQGKITGTQYDPRYPYITEQVQASILKSTPQRPVKLILSFGKHAGSGCECCNLAYRIRLYSH